MLYTKGWLDIAKITMPNVVNYCRKHNYLWNIQCIDEPYDAFEKIKQIQGIFERDEADVVMSMDCDCLVTNYTKKIESLLNDKYHFYISKDYNGINAGVFICKNTEWCKWFLSESLELKGEPKIYCEQDAFSAMIRNLNMFADKVCFLRQGTINAYQYELYSEIPPQTEEQGQWVEGKSFILHLPGVSMGLRQQILSNTKVIYE